MKDDYHYKKIAYLGIPGSYSYLAAMNYFKKGNMCPNNTVAEVIKKVSSGICEFGVVPVENSTTGSINETYDSLIDSQANISGEVLLHIHHCLFAKKGAALKELKKCYSHYQAAAQCRLFLHENKKMEIIFTTDTASAAKSVKENDSCAICNRTAGKLYGLDLIKSDIEDNGNNFTRFFIIGKRNKRTGNKVSLVFSLPHVPGSLVSALEPMARYGLNLTKIESRPIYGKTFEYLFYIDLEFKDVDNLKLALNQLKEKIEFMKILGEYKMGEIYES